MQLQLPAKIRTRVAFDPKWWSEEGRLQDCQLDTLIQDLDKRIDDQSCLQYAMQTTELSNAMLAQFS